MTVEGGALARHNGKVVFLDKGLAGDWVDAEVLSDSRRFTKARLLKIHQPSSDRLDPWCPYFEECGGCTWQNLSMEKQLEWKEKRVRETLTRIGGVDSLGLEPIQSGKAKEYRTKISYAFGMNNEKKAALGLRQRSSHTSVSIKKCGLQPEAEEILTFLEENLIHGEGKKLPVWNKNKGYLRFAVVHTPNFLPFGEKQVVLELIVQKTKKANYFDTVVNILNKAFEAKIVTGVILSERQEKSSFASGKPIFTAGNTELYEAYGDLCHGDAFVFSPFSFMQSNTEITTRLLKTAFADCAITSKDKIWDLFCGVGVMGMCLANESGNRSDIKIYGIDGHPEAIKMAKYNSERLGFHKASYYARSLSDALANPPFEPDVIIIDPPRSGMEDQLVQYLATLNPRKMLYISCDVATQARDIKKLGWKVVKAHPFDMFPYTPHVENLVILEKN